MIEKPDHGYLSDKNPVAVWDRMPQHSQSGDIDLEASGKVAGIHVTLEAEVWGQ